jgi:putative ABC transport system permease protein
MIPVRYNLRSTLTRRATTAMTALGIALVVMILFILLGFVAGLRATMLGAGLEGNWIVLARSVTSEAASFVTREQYEIIRTSPDIATDPHGEPLISPEIIASFDPDPNGPLNASAFTYLRGVYPIAYKVHRGIRAETGRLPRAGEPELVVGRRLAAKYPELAAGHQLRFGRRVWTIVGTFSDQGSARESEALTDLDQLAQDIHYGSGFAALHVVMKPGMGVSFEAALTRDARLRLDAMPEREFYAKQSRLADELRDLGMIVALMLGIGAAFGGMNTMYAAVARRAREVGVLRALGFGRAAILSSFVLESTAIGLAGGVAGELLGVAVAFATGLSSRLMNVQAFIFSFRLAPSAFVTGLVAAALIGALGGLAPAWRASRTGIIDSLRAA